MTREEEIRARLEAYDATLGESIDVQLDSWRPANKSAVTDLRFMLGVVDKERKENERLRGAFERIQNRANQAERQFENRQSNPNRWDLSWWRGHADGLHKASEIAQQSLQGENE